MAQGKKAEKNSGLTRRESLINAGALATGLVATGGLQVVLLWEVEEELHLPLILQERRFLGNIKDWMLNW